MRTATGVIMLAATGGLIVWDIIAVIRGGTQATISQIVRDQAIKRPMLPFAIGVLCGHWFWSL